MTTIRKPIGDPSRQPKALEAKPAPERKTREHCEFCRRVRAMARRAFRWPRRAS
jgi:hypothetical protein